jgi:hypothetical protein
MKIVQYKAVESYLFAPQMNSSSPPQNMLYTGRYLPRCFQSSCLLGAPSVAESVMLFSDIPVKYDQLLHHATSLKALRLSNMRIVLAPTG